MVSQVGGNRKWFATGTPWRRGSQSPIVATEIILFAAIPFLKHGQPEFLFWSTFAPHKRKHIFAERTATIAKINK